MLAIVSIIYISSGTQKTKQVNINQSDVGVSLIQDVVGPTQQLPAQEYQTRQPQETSLCNQEGNGSQKPEKCRIAYLLNFGNLSWALRLWK